MENCIARQPIFNIDKTVFGYELLYREKGANIYTGSNGDTATLNVMINSFLSVGMDTLTGDKKAFINFTERLITEEVASLFSNEHMVVELLETIEPTEGVIEACKNLKGAGYSIVLDDFIIREGYEPLIEIADIIKLDFLNIPYEENEAIIKKYKNKKIKFLAEKIETIEDFNRALMLGCVLFQGYFFAKPEILPSRTIPPYKINYLRLLNEVNGVDPDFDKLAEIIEHDVSFSYEVLKLVNSAAYYRNNKISSIKQALVYMGLSDVRKWIYIAVMRNLGTDKPSEIINYSMIRLKFMEFLANRLGQSHKSSEYITVGMLSLIDALMDMEMSVILQAIHLSDDIKNILLKNKKDGMLATCYQLVLEYEHANIEEVTELSNLLGLQISEISQMYYDALDWLRAITGE